MKRKFYFHGFVKSVKSYVRQEGSIVLSEKDKVLTNKVYNKLVSCAYTYSLVCQK